MKNKREWKTRWVDIRVEADGPGKIEDRNTYEVYVCPKCGGFMLAEGRPFPKKCLHCGWVRPVQDAVLNDLRRARAGLTGYYESEIANAICLLLDLEIERRESGQYSYEINLPENAEIRWAAVKKWTGENNENEEGEK